MVPADVAIVIEVVSVKTKLDKFLISAWNKETVILYVEIIVKLRQSFTFYEDIEAHDPLLVIDVVTRVPVEELEYPVHDDIISDVEVLVKELAKLLSVQFGIDALGFLKNHHNLSELSICILLGYRCLTNFAV